GGHVQFAGHAQRHRDGVGGGGGVEAVEEPHALLGGRERQPARPRTRDQRRSGGRVRFRDRGGQLGHPRRLEQGAHRDLAAKGGGDAGGGLGGEQRAAAEGEEIVVRADRLVGRAGEHLGEHARDHGLERAGGLAVDGAGEHGGGQGGAVEFAVDG